MEIADIAAPISGDKPYQQKARQILPVLVKHAEAGLLTTYGDLAEELGLSSFPMQLNSPLHHIGQVISNLEQSQKSKIPQIACIVVNKETKMPSKGFDASLQKLQLPNMTDLKRQDIIKVEQVKVFDYKQWHQVLQALDLETP